MGQAKSKGSLQERKKQSMLKQRELLPSSMDCNECGKTITEIIPLQANKIHGVNGIGFGICSQCDKVTFGFDTTVDRVEEIKNIMANIDPKIFYPILDGVRKEYLETVK